MYKFGIVHYWHRSWHEDSENYSGKGNKSFDGRVIY